MDNLGLYKLFDPSSIAVIGASRHKEKVGNVVFRNLISTFKGKVFPVNNKAEDVEGVKAYKSVKEIPDPVDLAVITVPRDFVPQVLEEAGEKGVKAVIVITAGFREVGEEKLEEEIVAIARKHGMRLLGPNTFGVITPSFNSTFAFTEVKRGNIALVVQSGGLGVYMLEYARKSRMGVSYMVSLGNQADVKEYEVLDYLAKDSMTKAVFVYLEGVSDGEKFLDVLTEASLKKPVVFLKGGKTSQGSKAAKTHTGSIAGSYEVFKAAVRTGGGILVDDLRDFLNLAKLLEYNEPVSSDVLIVTNSGGHGVLTADEAAERGLNLIELPNYVKEELRKVLPPTSVPHNPLDLTGDATRERYSSALRVVEGINATKVVIVESLPFISSAEVARAVSYFKGRGVVGVVMGMDEEIAMRVLESAGVPGFFFPEDAIRAISLSSRRPSPRKKIKTKQPIEAAVELTKDKASLSDFEALKLMEIYGIRTPKWGVAESEEDAQRIADSIGYPVVMKISPEEPVHKTELRGVALNVTRDQVRETYRRLSQITRRILVQQQMTGLEIFVGGLKDPVFGHVVVVGPGGIYVDVLRMASYGIAPIYEDEAYEMLRESKVLDMLKARKRGYDEHSLIRTLVTVSRMIVDLDVKEMDINPLFVNETGAYATDVRILLK
ncbi:MAG: acetate--CoA ligase family protein [Thermoprotei archaeon]